MPLRAGLVDEINLQNGIWIILDIGFAGDKKATCGLAINDSLPIEVTFSEASSRISAIILDSNVPVNVVIEAPLSVSFSKSGNPAGRSVEKKGQKTRYWYVGLGCAVLVAAQYLICRIISDCEGKDVRLFEGFVSFKPAGKISNHSDDAERLRSVIADPDKYRSNIVQPSKLAVSSTDTIKSAFDTLGYDIGVPPVIVG
jgi:hypothetical protein